MNITKIILLMFAVLIFIGCSKKTEPPPPIEDLTIEAEAIIKKFAKEFKLRIKSRMKISADYAVNTFSRDMPRLIARINKEEKKWSFRRVALQPFNHKSIAKGWEVDVLNDITDEKKKGKRLKQLTYAKIVGNEFRYLRPQSLSGACIKCHTNKRPDDIKESLESIYPKENIIDSKYGDIIGAYSLVRKL